MPRQQIIYGHRNKIALINNPTIMNMKYPVKPLYHAMVMGNDQNG